jgi:hypothetical protein
MRRFIVCCSIAGLGSSNALLLSPALAQEPTPACQIVASKAGQMFTNSFLATRLESTGADSYFRVECTGKVSGKLRLSLGAGNRVYNGFAQFKVVSANGVFTPTNLGYTNSPVLIPYANSSGKSAGEVRYQVQVVAPSGYLLPANRDYAVKVQAESIQ